MFFRWQRHFHTRSAAVKDKIAAIGTVEYTAESKGKIDEARTAYNALTADQKALVPTETVQKLNAAVKEMTDIVAAKDADDVVNALPATEKITAKDKAKVQAAQEAYDALTDEQKAKGPAATAQEVAAVIDKINAKNPDEAKTAKARAAYEALTPEQKAMVGNYNALTNAEQKIENAKDSGKNVSSAPTVNVLALVLLSLFCLAVLGCIIYIIASIFKKK